MLRRFGADYPFKAPEVKFVTPCFHPNVDQYGNICLDILKEKWSAAYSVRTVLLSIQSLLGRFTELPSCQLLRKCTTLKSSASLECRRAQQRFAAQPACCKALGQWSGGVQARAAQEACRGAAVVSICVIWMHNDLVLGRATDCYPDSADTAAAIKHYGDLSRRGYSDFAYCTGQRLLLDA